ncbi:MAG: 2-phospho-L-lactate guanylyltransferase [Gammaproteobacteria bacterium]
MSGIVAVVPVKDLANAKQRLAPALAPAARAALARCMLEDVLEALRASRRLDGILLVTLDPWAESLARRHGARVHHEPGNRGHTAAVRSGAERLIRDGVHGLLTMPGDIPLVTAAEIDAVIEAHDPVRGVTIVPAYDRRGSNAIACTPPDVLEFAFGDDSFLPHLQAARRAGIEPTVIVQPGIGLDVDRPEELEAFARSASPTRSYAWLRDNGLLPSCAAPRVAGA